MFEEQLKNGIAACQSLYYTETADLLNLQQTVLTVCKKLGYSVYRWAPSTGLECLMCIDRTTKGADGTWNRREDKEVTFNATRDNVNCDPLTLIKRLTSEFRGPINGGCMQSRCLIIAEALDAVMTNPVILNSFVDALAYNELVADHVNILMAGSNLKIPAEVLEYAEPLPLDLPGEAQFTEMIAKLRKTVLASIDSGGFPETSKKKMTAKATKAWLFNEELCTIVIEHLKGMTNMRALTALNYAISQFPYEETLDNVLPLISRRKMIDIERSKVLRFIPYEDQPNSEEIKGFENFTEFVQIRARAYSKEARELRIDKPKGVALIGPAGTGKSFAAKAVGKMLKLPVIVLDIGSLFGSLVGESESKVRNALKVIDAVDGCILFIDEADKAFAGNRSTTTGDSGTAQRVFGTILNWLQDHRSATFVIITLNNAEALPPEFLRAGRFDKLFYTDLPTTAERRKIIDVHFKKRNCFPTFAKKDWDEILEATDQFVGAELEETVKDARLIAFNLRKDGTPTAEEFLACCRDRRPMAKTAGIDGIARILDFCKNRATPVSSSQEVPTVEPLSYLNVNFNEDL